MAKGSRGGRRITPTNAKATENMNEAQLAKEISRQKRIIAKAKEQRASFKPDRSFQEAYPLGAGGLSKKEAEKRVGKDSAATLRQAQKLKNIIQRQETAERQLANLEKAMKAVKGTGKTRKEIEKAKLDSTAVTVKWKTTRKQSRTADGGLLPRVIEGGGFRIVGSSVMRIYKGEKQIATAYNLKEAKAIAERYKQKEG